jgi:hypothetical protein
MQNIIVLVHGGNSFGKRGDDNIIKRPKIKNTYSTNKGKVV